MMEPLTLLLAIDDSDYSSHVAKVASQLFGGRELKVHLLSVIDSLRGPETEPGLEVEVKKVEAQMLKELHIKIAADNFSFPGVTIVSEVVEGRPAATIALQAASIGADLIVIGTRGRSKLSAAVLGSVSEEVTRDSKVPVLVVRKPQSLPS